MSSSLRRYLVAVVLGATFLTAVPAWSAEVAKDTLDVVVLRPVGFAAAAVGTAIFVGTLPFTAVMGTWREPAYALVYRPIKFTFRRPLGEY